MREHFLQCLEKGKINPFPSATVRGKRPATRKRVQLHCDCCLPEDGEEPMLSARRAKSGIIRAAKRFQTLFFIATTKRIGFVIIVTLCNFFILYTYLFNLEITTF